MIYKRLATGMYFSNCYILGDRGEGVIIDPGVDSKEIWKNVTQLGLSIKYIILTHSHIDHICHVEEIKTLTNAKVAVHHLDAKGLMDARYNGSALFGLSQTYSEADMLLKDEDALEAGGVQYEILHTPGHTPGGICIKAENKVFTGDTLFRNSIGRSDLGYGDEGELKHSIKTKLLALPDETEVYPGHGTFSTIGYERENNPFLFGLFK